MIKENTGYLQNKRDDDNKYFSAFALLAGCKNKSERQELGAH